MSDSRVVVHQDDVSKALVTPGARMQNARDTQ